MGVDVSTLSPTIPATAAPDVGGAACRSGGGWVGFSSTVDGADRVVRNIRIWLGGLQPVAVRCTRTEAALTGHPFTPAMIESVLPVLMDEVGLDDMSWGGRPEWRRALYGGFLLKVSLMLIPASQGDGVSGISIPVVPTQPSAETRMSTAVQTYSLPHTVEASATLGSAFCTGTGDFMQGPDPNMPLMHLRANASHEP